MKTSYVKLTPLMASIAAFSLTLTPVMYAQTADQTANSKTLNSVPATDNQSSTTGAPGQGASAVDKTDSKDTTNSLDKNPGTANTDSAPASATKDPTTATTEDKHKVAKSDKSDADKPMTDKEFVETAAQGGMTEVELGKLAADKGTSPDVKKFGSHMVEDHSKANDDLKSIADKKGIAVPATLDAKHQAMVDKFQHLSGPAFDKAYVRAMVKDHEKTADCFRTESKTGQDPDVKAFAGDTLKTIEMHLSDIKSIQSSMK
jgi:putative membrane protein